MKKSHAFAAIEQYFSVRSWVDDARDAASVNHTLNGFDGHKIWFGVKITELGAEISEPAPSSQQYHPRLIVKEEFQGLVSARMACKRPGWNSQR